MGGSEYYKSLLLAAKTWEVRSQYLERLKAPVQGDNDRIPASVPRTAADELIKVADTLAERGDDDAAAAIRIGLLPIINVHLAEKHNQQRNNDLVRLKNLIPYLPVEEQLNAVLTIAGDIRTSVVISRELADAPFEYLFGALLNVADPDRKKKPTQKPKKEIIKDPAAELIRELMPTLSEENRGKVFDFMVEQIRYKKPEREDSFWREDTLDEMCKGNDTQMGAVEFLFEHIRTLAIADHGPWLTRVHGVYRQQLKDVEEARAQSKYYSDSPDKVEQARKSLSALKLATQVMGLHDVHKRRWDQLEEDAVIQDLAATTGQSVAELKKQKNAITLLDYLKTEDRQRARKYRESRGDQNVFGMLHDALTQAKKNSEESDKKAAELFGRCSAEEKQFLLATMLSDPDPNVNAGNAYKDIADLIFPDEKPAEIGVVEAGRFARNAIDKLIDISKADKSDMSQYRPQSLIYALGRSTGALADVRQRRDAANAIRSWIQDDELPEIVIDSIDALGSLVPTLPEGDWSGYTKKVARTSWNRRVYASAFPYLEKLANKTENPDIRKQHIDQLFAPIRNPEKEDVNRLDPEPVPFEAAGPLLVIAGKIGGEGGENIKREVKEVALKVARDENIGWRGGAFMAIGKLMDDAQPDEKLEMALALVHGLKSFDTIDFEDRILNKWRTNHTPGILKEKLGSLEPDQRDKVLDAVFARLDAPEQKGMVGEERTYHIQRGAAQFLLDHIGELPLEDQQRWLEDIHDVYVDQGKRGLPGERDSKSASYYLASELINKQPRLKAKWTELEKKPKKRNR
ncbi:MAG: hypothetical protein ABH950_08300 [Candidatus Altiarchaeota archaeon]